VATIERVQVCKVAGRLLSEPARIGSHDGSGLRISQKLMVHIGEQSRYGSQPVYRELIRRIHAAGGAGATALRGVRGFYADGVPFSDRLLSIRRNVPVVVVIVDSPEKISALWPIVDELTSESGIVTSELVPASTGLAGDAGGELALAATPASQASR
jgi:PII-like signaling protein